MLLCHSLFIDIHIAVFRGKPKINVSTENSAAAVSDSKRQARVTLASFDGTAVSFRVEFEMYQITFISLHDAADKFNSLSSMSICTPLFFYKN